MGAPQNPNTVVIRNKFYPKGLTEQEVWDYYDKNRYKLLDETKNKNLAVVIMVDENKPVIRKNVGGRPIRLTPQNYDKLVNGRTVTFYSEMRPYEQYGIIDIDTDDGFEWAKKYTAAVYDYVMDEMPLVKKAQIRYTGKTSFHIICDFGKKMKTEVIYFLLEKFLRNSDLAKVYTIERKRRPGVPNLDLSPNKLRGNYITLHSLSVVGLRCMEVPYNKLKSFKQNDARIK